MTIQKRTISLPHEQAVYIDKLVAAGTFASASDVVRAGLKALKERDDAMERWLKDEVAPLYDRMQEHPEQALSAEEVFAELRARHAGRPKAKT